MKTSFLLVFALIISCAFSTDAALIDRGGGLIYDDVLNVTWLQNANYGAGSSFDNGASAVDGKMTWENAVRWADQLVFSDSIRNVKWSDWRLPSIKPASPPSFNLVWSLIGTTDVGYNITSPNSELMHMYHISLGNIGAYKLDGNPRYNPGDNWGLVNKGPFLNLYSAMYWPESEIHYSNGILIFNMVGGSQANWKMTDEAYAWAVRDGDVAAVPIPAAAWLLGAGLIGVVGLRRKFQC